MDSFLTIFFVSYLFQLENNIINLCVNLKTFQIIYNHCEIYEWVHNNFLSSHNNNNTQESYSTNTSEGSKFPLSRQNPFTGHLIDHDLPNNGDGRKWLNNDQSNPEMPKTYEDTLQSVNGEDNLSLIQWIMKRIVINGCAEFWNVSLLMKLDNVNAAMSVSHTRLVLDQLNEKRMYPYNNRVLNLLLSQRHWCIEVMIESLWWSLGNSINDTNNLKKTHSLGSPFFLGVSLVKLCSTPLATKLEFSIHTLRTEYSMSLSNYILKTLRCIQQYGILRNQSNNTIWRTNSNPLAASAAATNSNNSSEIGFLINAQIKDVTAYFINHHNACLLLSSSDITLSRSMEMYQLKMETFQMSIMHTLSASSLCLNDFTDIFVSCKELRIEYELFSLNDSSKFTIYIPFDTEMMWNSNLHMHILTLSRDILSLHGKLSNVINKSNLQNISKTERNPTTIELVGGRCIIIDLKLSDCHSMQWYYENIYLSCNTTSNLFLSAEKIYIKIDEQHIFTFKDVDVHLFENLDILTTERANCEGFILPTNKAYAITIGTFKVDSFNILFRDEMYLSF